MLEVISNEDENQNNLPKIITENKVDGLIVVGRLKSDYLKEIRKST